MVPGAPPDSPPDGALHFLSSGGEMGAAVRDFDWTASPLESPETWPQSLRTAAGIMLSSKFPMFLAWGSELTLLYNDGYIDMLGHKHPALGQPLETVWREIWADIGPLTERAMAGESTFSENLPLTMRRKGYDEATWFTFSYSPLRGEDGAVCGMFCACVETTDTVLAERRRIGEAERLRLLFDRAPSFMAVVRGPDHVFELANAAYLNLVGQRDVVGRPVREALPEVRGQGFIDLLDQVYREGVAFTGHSTSIRISRAPGLEPEERLLDFVYQPIIDADGSVTGIFVDGYDVTERNFAEERLRESEQRFRLIADSAPVPMWVTRLDRKRSFVNIAYAEFLGVSYDEAIDFDWRAVIHPDDMERLMHESLAGEATLKPFRLDARYRRGDGEWCWLRSESQPRWGPGGEHVGFIGVASDITESKLAEEALEQRVAARTADLSAALDRLQKEVADRERAEDALRQAQKMEAVGQLTGGIAHDFNNLLTPIMGGLEMIASRVDDPRLKRIAETALESTRRGAKLTGQLLAFSRIQRISMAAVPINRVIANMRHMLIHTIGSGIEIRTEFNPAASHAFCDENQLENAILNLAINGRDAMPDGGVLTISTDATWVEASADLDAGDYVCVSVGDTGQGMEPDIVGRAMEPFFSTKPVGKGTGLGLAQVYGIAHQSGGTVRIESEPGKGTIVHLLLRRAAAGEDAAAVPEIDADADGRPAAQGARILVVDDDPDVRLFVEDLLDGLGYSVEGKDSGEAAIEWLADHLPDLVLLDFAMPGMNGAEAALKIRELHPLLPIIFVTGYAESEQLETALGPDVAVLRKPFTIDGLTTAITLAFGDKA